MDPGEDHVESEDGGDLIKLEFSKHLTATCDVSSSDYTSELTVEPNHKDFTEHNDTEKPEIIKTIAEDVIVTQSVSDSKTDNEAYIENKVISPCSNSYSECSEREIILEPLSPSVEQGAVLKAQKSPASDVQQNKDLADGIPAGPSDDREDISDGELDVDSAESLEKDQHLEYVPSESSTAEVSLEPARQAPDPSVSDHPQLINDDTRGTLSSDDREIIDLKLEDAIGKSDEGGDVNRESKGPSEDLEAVSDDELLPETFQSADDSVVSTNITLLGEEVSSEDDSNPHGAPCDIELPRRTSSTLNQEVPDISDGLTEHHRTLDRNDSISHLISETVNLPALEAEPISEEEDIEQEENALGQDGDGEAGEIQSPVPIRSPISEQGGLLGEVEPISADESSDTDGELPSGDEDSRSELIPGKSTNNNFESIESDEDGNISTECSEKHGSLKIILGRKQKKTGSDYMETISDDENLEMAQESLLTDQHYIKSSEDSQLQTSPAIKDVEVDKKQVTTNFNEHQVELDYEENEGDEGDGKIEVLQPEAKLQKDGAGEEGELEEVGETEKDEGELSDDDCEEGEIKEPGSKKPFVKPMCRFFQRGNCTWGVNCRFLHPGVNDKGNYQMIEIPGFKPTGIRARIGLPGQWPEQPEEPAELPPPPVPDIPPVETAWERGLRIAKEQRKKANERKELEPDFEDKRLNLSVDEERELNKENERMPKIIPKDPYYDQQA
ncbi:hypothetical protein Btru_075639 [Bulinus truncatus]|nr:hypothetical protein Btru_075639 [Bulinus truncatus]